MESRDIIIISTATQQRYTINTNAETLGDLKRAMDENNIHYAGMDFYEGCSKTEITSNGSLLPHDVNYKGKITNNLVFMLSNSNKKISSGIMTRKECYDYIKAKALSQHIKNRTGKSFINLSTDNLNKEIDIYKEHYELPKKENSTIKFNKNKDLKDFIEDADKVLNKSKEVKSEDKKYSINFDSIIGKIDSIIIDLNNIKDSFNKGESSKQFSESDLNEMMNDFYNK